ncbi:hypothetical protein Q8G20_12540, partial [Klebsiella pneumoniae]|uniref:hypothetical protein n=1 Tax=Klebsiella pneumoniae TaxID=573 RepID=UPI00272F7994
AVFVVFFFFFYKQKGPWDFAFFLGGWEFCKRDGAFFFSKEISEPPPLWLPVHYTFFFTQCQYMG